MREHMRESAFSLTQAKFAAGELAYVPTHLPVTSLSLESRDLLVDARSPIVLENVKQATFKVRLETENVAGVQLPIFRKFGDLSQPSMLYLLQWDRAIGESERVYSLNDHRRTLCRPRLDGSLQGRRTSQALTRVPLQIARAVDRTRLASGIDRDDMPRLNPP